MVRFLKFMEDIIMADIVTQGPQVVAADDNITFTANRIPSRCRNIRHEAQSGRIVLLPGLYRVNFNANFTAAAASQALFEIAQDGEGVPGAVIRTNFAAGEYANGAVTVEVRVYGPCCTTLTVHNSGDDVITVENANLVVSRVG